jgi:hypothetical protein
MLEPGEARMTQIMGAEEAKTMYDDAAISC